jgi:hypothetical protein
MEETSGKAQTERTLTEDDIVKLVDRELRAKHSLSVKYWYPTLGAVILASAVAVWWFHGVISPIEERLDELSRAPLAQTSGPVQFQYFIEDIDVDKLSPEQATRIQNAIYTLSERRDLVAIIAGYTKGYARESQKDSVATSTRFAELVKAEFLKAGISTDRIFSKGYGSRVPLNFPRKHQRNVCIMLCDIYVVMQNATY